MEENFRKLRLINKMIVSISNFYAVSISDFDITLQGKYNSNLVKKLSRIFNFSTDVNGNLCAEKRYVKIVLTD